MNEERLLILKMVADGKLGPDEADRLIAALDGGAPPEADRRFAADMAYDLLSRTAKDLQKGVQDLSVRAEGELRRAHEHMRQREASLREQIESIAENFGRRPGSRKSKSGTRGHPGATIRVEVEEDDTTDDAEEKAGPDDSGRTGGSAKKGEDDGDK